MRELDFLPPAYKIARRRRRALLVRSGAALVLSAVLAPVVAPWIAFIQPTRRPTASHATSPARAPAGPARRAPADRRASQDDTTATIHSAYGQ